MTVRPETPGAAAPMIAAKLLRKSAAKIAGDHQIVICILREASPSGSAWCSARIIAAKFTGNRISQHSWQFYHIPCVSGGTSPSNTATCCAPVNTPRLPGNGTSQHGCRFQNIPCGSLRGVSKRFRHTCIQHSALACDIAQPHR